MDAQNIQIADGIRQVYTSKLNKVSVSPKYGLRHWLATSESFIPIETENSKCIELSLYDASEVLAYVASDIVRLACASVETINSIFEVPNDKKFLAWQLVKYYYSAFYAAHSTLKICGMGLTQIDKKMIDNIRRRASTLGISLPAFEKGIYCVNLSVDEAKIVLYQIKRYDDSHKGLWQRYADFLDVLTGISVITDRFDSNCIRRRILDEPIPHCAYSHLPAADANLIITRLDQIKSVINTRGDNNWLSSVRNAVNYNHAYGVWYPFESFDDSYTLIIERSRLYLENSLSSKLLIKEDDTELSKFVNCCQLINSINRNILVDISERHPDNKSFLRKGPLEYINHHGIKST